jgi:hypothetical protein
MFCRLLILLNEKIRYFLMIFGINCKSKWIRNFITSLTLSILSLVVIQITFPFSLSDELKI